MADTLHTVIAPWPLIKKILFRFFFIYFIFYISPWNWLDILPGAKYILGYYNQFYEWAVITVNSNLFHVFHIKNVKPVSNGSGDTSFDWASIYLLLVIAFTGTIIWSFADQKRKNYHPLNYLLCIIIRYSLIFTVFTYGMFKILALQMPFPMLSQLATPLGDFLPMRLSWMFIGYSTPYEMFSGILEALAAVLLLYRRTATLGLLIATAVLINVMTLNLCYDIPVKLYSMNLVLQCMYLLANDSKRLLYFFIINKPATVCSVYDYPLTKKWMRITRIVLKLAFIFMISKILYNTLQNAGIANKVTGHKDFKPGIYDVTRFVINKDTIPASTTDTLRWKDVIFEKNNTGSINSRDTMFRQRYGRGYFAYSVDSLQPVINFEKSLQDNTIIFSLHYQRPDSNTIQLWSKQRNDSLFIELKRSNHHFQLSEKQFHWLSEANR